ncbi:ankyrin repeat domain-containing protein [Wolbachia endosymbiont of Folsomia candida]|uniref:ankyrin repeat domain-containing protein n=1 Tax=Wolbachia endosymbiont of Folsomia candida TaxID=169402 RepID=UPI000A544F8A|nr:ankyrin repeat domain-containing protein [Wolbachia endosymbiont of Folsomia candida]APR97871.1 hypothetical protein ASM33_00825 [Wolbachia endosymbiont of Folsomia candida]APR98670.1 hypothetical protein ASM33_05495 [Wolbachia endosymbiont of Folsomia candida]
MRELNKRLRELLKNSFEDINSKDENGNTILHLAAQFSSYKTVKLLIEKGANINIENNEGEVPLHRAALARKVRNVRALIEAEADVHCTNYNGSTPLHLASGSVWLFREKGGNAKGTVKELLKAGANVNAIDRFGTSPLFRAKDQPELAELIKKYGGKIIDRIGTGVQEFANFYGDHLIKEISSAVKNLYAEEIEELKQKKYKEPDVEDDKEPSVKDDKDKKYH